MTKETQTPGAIEAEVTKFNRLADTWWDKNGPMAPLHGLNAIRLPFINSTLTKAGLVPQSTRLLDVGCGAGILSESLAEKDYMVCGTDPASKNIAIARQHARENGVAVSYQEGLVEEIVDTHFDAVLVMEVVEHVPDITQLLHQCADRLKPGGWLFVATINRTLASFITAIIGAEYIFRMLPIGTHDWHQFVKPGEIIKPLNNFELVEQTGVSVNPIGPKFKLTQYMGINYMLSLRKNS